MYLKKKFCFVSFFDHTKNKRIGTLDLNESSVKKFSSRTTLEQSNRIKSADRSFCFLNTTIIFCQWPKATNSRTLFGLALFLDSDLQSFNFFHIAFIPLNRIIHIGGSNVTIKVAPEQSPRLGTMFPFRLCQKEQYFEFSTNILFSSIISSPSSS